MYKAFQLFDHDNSGDLNENELLQLIKSAIDYLPTPSSDDIKHLIKEFGSGKEALNYQQVKRFLQSNVLRPEQSGRYFVSLSLAEAETIRRIMHMRLEKDIIGKPISLFSHREQWLHSRKEANWSTIFYYTTNSFIYLFIYLFI